MKRNRQTIWLVSMLSIMVVLSAYYLFTDDLGETQTAGTEGEMDRIVLDLLQDNHGHSHGTLNPLGLLNDGVKTDAEILDDYNVRTVGANQFIALEMDREEQLSRKVEELSAVSADATLENEEVQAAFAEIISIQAMQEKVDMVEEQLKRNYENAIVREVNNVWQVMVQSDSLVKSEVVSILDLVMSELDVPADRVTVQYVH